MHTHTTDLLIFIISTCVDAWGGGGGGMRKEDGDTKDFWSTPKSVFCKAIYIVYEYWQNTCLITTL